MLNDSVKKCSTQFKVMNAQQVIQASAQGKRSSMLTNQQSHPSVHKGISYEHQTAQSQVVCGDDEARNVGC